MPAIREGLALLLPAPATTLLLRSALVPGEAARTAWSRWRESGADPRETIGASTGVGRLLPQLHANLVAQGVALDDALRPYLRAAELRERLRCATYQRALREVLGRLAGLPVDFTVLRGAVLAHTAFDAHHLRHCHDLDVWVDSANRDRIVAAFAGDGCPIAPLDRGTVRIEHASGLPVLLHVALLGTRVYALNGEDLRARRRSVALGSARVLALAAEDTLIHVCVHAATAGRLDDPGWVADAFGILRREELDWRRVCEVVVKSRLALPVGVTLEYLVAALGAPVPREVLARLREASGTNAVAESRAAVRGVLLAHRGALHSVLSHGSLGTRLAVTRALLLPPGRETVKLVVGYLARHMRAASRAAASRLGAAWAQATPPSARKRATCTLPRAASGVETGTAAGARGASREAGRATSRFG